MGREVFVGWATSCEFHSLLSDLIDAQMASVHSQTYRGLSIFSLL